LSALKFLAGSWRRRRALPLAPHSAARVLAAEAGCSRWRGCDEEGVLPRSNSRCDGLRCERPRSGATCAAGRRALIDETSARRGSARPPADQTAEWPCERSSAAGEAAYLPTRARPPGVAAPQVSDAVATDSRGGASCEPLSGRCAALTHRSDAMTGSSWSNPSPRSRSRDCREGLLMIILAHDVFCDFCMGPELPCTRVHQPCCLQRCAGSLRAALARPRARASRYKLAPRRRPHLATGESMPACRRARWRPPPITCPE
jgi:hypothetical protein